MKTDVVWVLGHRIEMPALRPFPCSLSVGLIAVWLFNGGMLVFNMQHGALVWATVNLVGFALASWTATVLILSWLALRQAHQDLLKAKIQLLLLQNLERN